MSVARHPRPKELEGVPIEEIMKKYVGRFTREEAATGRRSRTPRSKASSARSTASSAPAAPASTTIRP